VPETASVAVAVGLGTVHTRDGNRDEEDGATSAEAPVARDEQQTRARLKRRGVMAAVLLLFRTTPGSNKL